MFDGVAGDDSGRVWLTLWLLCSFVFVSFCTHRLGRETRSVPSLLYFDFDSWLGVSGVLQTLICAPVVRPKRCPTSSNPALLPSWTVVCPSFTLLMMLLLPGWPTMGLNRIRKKKKKWDQSFLQPTEFWAELQNLSPKCQTLINFLLMLTVEYFGL